MRHHHNKKNKQLRPKNRKTKSMLIFDEMARKEYLTGFRKRKEERRKIAQEQVEKIIKEEKKLLRQKTKEFLEVKTRHQVLPPDLEELIHKEVNEMPDHTVTVTDISEVDLAGHGGVRLGWNTGQSASIDEDDDEEIDQDDEVHQILQQDSVSKYERNVRNIKNRIQKTAKHLKPKKSVHKKKRTLSKKAKHRKVKENT